MKLDGLKNSQVLSSILITIKKGNSVIEMWNLVLGSEFCEVVS